MMHKQRIISILILIAMLAVLVCGCAESSPAADESAETVPVEEPEGADDGAHTDEIDTIDDDTIVAVVNGTQISYSKFAEQMAGIEALYSAMGDTLSTDEINQELTEQAASVLEMLISDVILEQKAEEYDIQLSEDEQAEADKTWESIKERFSATISANYPTIEGDELDDMVLLALESSGLDRDMVLQSARTSARTAKLRELIESEAGEATSAEIEAYYTTLLAEQQTEFEDDVTAFESAMLDGTVVVYIPKEYRVIHEWEFRYEDDVIALLNQLKELDTAESSAYEDTLDAEQKRTLEAIGVARAKVKKGSDFDALYAEENPGQTPRENYICESSSRFSKEYYDAAMSIDAVGGLSAQAIAQNYGYKLLCWVRTLQPGTVPLVDVREDIASQLSTERRSECWKAAQERWRGEAEITVNQELITYS